MHVKEAVEKFREAHFQTTHFHIAEKLEIDIVIFDTTFTFSMIVWPVTHTSTEYYTEGSKNITEDDFFQNPTGERIHIKSEGWFGKKAKLTEKEMVNWQRELNSRYAETIRIKDNSIHMEYYIYTATDEIDYNLLDALGEKFISDLHKICKETKEYIQECRKINPNSGCYITTAVCSSLGKTDNCYELDAFRRFRDEWLSMQPEGKEMIREYYSLAPQIVSVIDNEKEASSIYQQIWSQYLRPCLQYIEAHDMNKCKILYIKMVKQLERQFLR